MTAAKYSQTVVTEFSAERAEKILEAAAVIRETRDRFRQVSRARPYDAPAANKAFDENSAAWSNMRRLLEL